MSYQVLARKWRPQTFHQLVGQEHVKQALVNALNEQRLHHAYLFTGTRGVGKTTIARIFAKSLNCDEGITSNPCGKCQSCLDIEAGKFIDLIEIDAASRTKVEDTREILDNVQYAPTRGRYKVYLIDEVHMLSKHSFNALLKTLEEPPEHVKFLLATTDPQKLPITILSRCLQFNLNAMSQSQIVSQLTHILPQEQIQFEEPALKALAKAADGSMRDALSLTDQAIAQTNAQLTLAAVQDMLGLMDVSHAVSILASVLCQDAPAVLDEVAQIAVKNGNYLAVLDDLIALLHAIQLTQLVPQAAKISVFSESDIATLSEQITPQQVQLFYQLLLNGKKDLQWAPEQKLGFEMVLLRLIAFEHADSQPSAASSAQTGSASNNSVQAQPAPTASPRQGLQDIRARLKQNNASAGGNTTQHTHAAPEIPEQSATPQVEAEAVQAQPKQAEPIQAETSQQPVVEHGDTNQPSELAQSIAHSSQVHSPVEQPHYQQNGESNAFNQQAQQNPQAPAQQEYAPEPQEQELAAQYEQVMQDAQEQGYTPAYEPQATQEVQQDASSQNTESASARLQAQQGQAQSAIARILQNRKISGAGQLLSAQGDEPKKSEAQNAPDSNVAQVTPKKKPVPFSERHKADESKLAPELLEQIAPQTLQAQEAPKEEAVPVPEGFASPISEIRFAHQQDDWAKLIEKMALGGRMRQFALHSIYHYENNQANIQVDISQRHLDSAVLRQKLQAALNDMYGSEVELIVEFAEGVIDSPYLIQQKIDAHRHQQAIETINQDPIVLQLIEQFSAEVDENTIQAL
ncbi:DNA polymerase III subunit gamma/tau [Pseudoalteromonas phenolica]|uniref:DNA polymerase III subunit gamma/tau n=1 Tax=Pseudoalteromonas phenolica TaxID=161398 RepID=UPI00110BFC3B|nr:DNA polymerase III subunit gamma/tau [Pseudoalteromonas phenolica]TMO53756.1 AAA family ATPase [Pseudoalteromonas phenolica]